jgi:tetratricopeptide (TPR) repeat protein
MTHLILILGLLLPSILPQTFTIIGRVRDQAGQPVSGIRVTLLDDNYGQVRAVFADSGGGFRFSGIISGIYFVRIEPAGTGYEEQTQRIELQSIRIRGSGNEPYPIDFILKPKKASPAPSRDMVFVQNVPDEARGEYERGANYLRNNKTDRGIVSLKNAIELFPDYFAALELLGAEFVKQGQFQSALPLLTHAIEINHRAPRSLYAIGVAHLKLNNSTNAVVWLKKSAELDPNNANTFMMLGLAYGNNREYAQSEAAFLRALRLGGKALAEAHFYLAGIYNKMERYREAASQLELYLKEEQNIKDRDAVKNSIDKLYEKAKEKEKAK